MRMTILKALLCGCVLAVVNGPVAAQDARGQKPRGNADQQQRRKEARLEKAEPQESGLIRTEFRFGGKVIKNAPYSAEAITESTQTLANGTKLSQKTVARVHRDGEGRTRREQSGAPVGPFATAGEAQRVVFISDPVAGVAYTLYPETRMAVRTALPPAEIINAADEKAAPPPPGQAGRKPPPLENTDRRPPPPENAERRPPRVDDRGQTVSLGKRVIEGLNSDGERTTVTIPTGSIGNNQPIEIVEERWKSPDLRTTLWSKTSDPRWGETTYRLTNIVRGEPDRSLFAVPSDYTIKEDNQENRPPGGKRRPPAIR